MSYPYVPAWYDDYGPRKGPTLGLMLHMAEGGGTVGYLDKKGNAPPRGVSVHAVCEYSGRVVQMLPWDEASGSLNPADRSTDKSYFGHTHLVDVLGDWWKDPNSAVLSMEIEGFAKSGPNPAQVNAIIAWAEDMKDQYPSLRGALGHADQTDTKRCPGSTLSMRRIFSSIGGHGLWPKGADVIRVSDETPKVMDLPLGTQLWDEDRNALVKVSATGVKVGTPTPFEAALRPNFHARAVYVTTGGVRVLAFVHNSDPGINVRPAPPSVGDATHEVALSVDGSTVYVAKV